MNQLQKVAAVLLFCMALTGAVTAQQRVWLRYASDVMAGVANPRTMCIQAGHPVPDGWWISGTCPVAAPPAPAPAPAHERDETQGTGVWPPGPDQLVVRAVDVMEGVAIPRLMCLQKGHTIPDGWWLRGGCAVSVGKIAPVAGPTRPTGQGGSTIYDRLITKYDNWQDCNEKACEDIPHTRAWISKRYRDGTVGSDDPPCVPLVWHHLRRICR